MQAIADELNTEGQRTTRGVKTLNEVLKNHVYICGVGRKNLRPESFIKCANAGLDCIDSIIAASSYSNRHYELHLILYAEAQAETSLPFCSVSSRLTRARTEERWETIRQVRSSFRSISLVKTRPSRRASILLVGSSRSMNGAGLKKARARATRCRCPSDRSEPLSASR